MPQNGNGNLTPVSVGNQLAVKHGSYSSIALGPRSAELADELREVVPAFDVCDEVALRVLCLALARLERAAAALEDAGPRQLARLEADARGWSNSVARLADAFGMTPTARSRLGLNLVRAREIIAGPTTDLSALSEEDLASLRSLLSKAEACSDREPDASLACSDFTGSPVAYLLPPAAQTCMESRIPP